ncbi:MAG: CAP domain-containing protein [Planctomycetota bacterium]|nr:CAP domain-containing protein [Planctomycetota bacterium]
MRHFLVVLCALALALPLTACGSGDSSNDLSTGTGPSNNRNSVPPGATPAPTPPLQDGTGTGMSARELAFASEVFRLVNEYRNNNGRGLVQWDAPLAAVAQGHTNDMQARGLLTHAGPPPCTVGSVCLTNRLISGAVPFVSAGENVAHGQLTAQQVMDDWIASASHRDNLLAPQWTHLGVGFREGVSPASAIMTGPWWTQVFIQR